MDISTTQRKLVVTILLSAAFISILNQTLLMIAMPPIMADFKIKASEAQWLTTIYLLTNGILIPITAFLIGRFSNKALLSVALALFSVGTLLGAFASNYTVLLVARVIQAAGAGIIMPLMQTVLLTMYPKENRGAVMGMAGLVTGFAPAIGPTLSGWLIEQFTWRYLFYTMIPVSIVVLIMALFMMKNVTKKQPGQFDTLSVILSSFGWGGLLYGFSVAGSAGFGDTIVWVSLVIGSISLGAFIYRQLNMDKPILEFRVFQSKVFTISTLLSALVYVLMIGSQILLTFYVQNVRQMSALETGFMLLPGALVMGFFSPQAGKIFDKFGGKWLAIIGFGLILIGTPAYVFLSMDTSIWFIAFLFSLISLGVSMIMMPLTTAGMNALPIHLMAHGTAVSSTLRMVAGAIVSALLVTIMSSVMNLYEKLPLTESMLYGIRMAFVAAGLLSLGGFVLALVYKEAPRNAR
ncbi:DHA2 family efflux MFS transporter permease subunit [Paenibacillus bouchesdurhonensis]|uniref:DHA2 family efflux MFS transporter permease subunit n=1 Tax=Paenibacillus bouchesdurhonensis TaxID=1870990 RepID=UPI000DA5EEA4|nr:DHA2 family efflux MFS transporter permease subunit [Paenibacillus bouchesdurhonensis]